MPKIEIQGQIQKESEPLAPFRDEANNQYLIDALAGRRYSSPQIKTLDNILLGALRDGRMRVISPITVELTHEGKHVIAEAIELNEFGFGQSVSEAIADLQRAIVELYFTLESEQLRLGADLQKIWHVLQKKIIKR